MQPEKTAQTKLNLKYHLLIITLLVSIALILSNSLTSAKSSQQTDPNDGQTISDQTEIPATTEQEEPPPSPGDDFVLSANNEWIHVNDVGVTLSQDIGTFATTDSKKGFYITSSNFSGSQPKTACSAGYHMASIWEILDVSNLVYAYDHPAAYTKGDSSFGPPSSWYGWVRTGYNNSTVNTAGLANCNGWTSNTAGEYGSIIRLAHDWVTAPGEIGTWDTSTWSCGGTAPVWCIQD